MFGIYLLELVDGLFINKVDSCLVDLVNVCEKVYCVVENEKVCVRNMISFLFK